MFEGYIDLRTIDGLSTKGTSIHRLDPRAKLLVTLLFTISVVSMPPYEITGLIPFFLFPVFLLSAGDIPLSFLLKRLAMVSPFVLLVGISNPILDRTPYDIGGMVVARGWISYLSIVLKFLLTMGAALLLAATTPFPALCNAMERMRMPRAFVVQLLFLYRLLFILTEEAMRMVRAREVRAFGRPLGVRDLVNAMGPLFLRALDRSERVHMAMVSRGFDGRLPVARDYSLGWRELLFISVFSALFLLFRWYDLPAVIGGIGEPSQDSL